MLCYKDKTFCGFQECRDFCKCDRALTKWVKKQAKAWMGEDAPICQFAEKPECFKK